MTFAPDSRWSYPGHPANGMAALENLDDEELAACMEQEGDYCPTHQEPDDDYDHYEHMQQIKERQNYWGD